MVRAFADLQNDDLGRAFADFSAVVRLDPNGFIGYQGRGDVYLASGDPGHAIADYTEAIRLNPKSVFAVHNRGLAYYAVKDYDKAIADFGSAVALKPNVSAFHMSKARALLAAGTDAVAALAEANEAVRLSPDYDDAYAVRGDVLRTSGHGAQAEADYKKAQSINRANTTAAEGLSLLAGAGVAK